MKTLWLRVINELFSLRLITTETGTSITPDTAMVTITDTSKYDWKQFTILSHLSSAVVLGFALRKVGVRYLDCP